VTRLAGTSRERDVNRDVYVVSEIQDRRGETRTKIAKMGDIMPGGGPNVHEEGTTREKNDGRKNSYTEELERRG
jgi:hypothetical protein